MPSEHTLSIVVPVLDEAATIAEALAPLGHRDRRPGAIRRARRFRGGGGFSRHPADGGHRVVAAAQTARTAALPARTGDDVGAPLGGPRRRAHDRADVATAARLLP